MFFEEINWRCYQKMGRSPCSWIGMIVIWPKAIYRLHGTLIKILIQFFFQTLKVLERAILNFTWIQKQRHKQQTNQKQFKTRQNCKRFPPLYFKCHYKAIVIKNMLLVLKLKCWSLNSNWKPINKSPCLWITKFS